MNTRWFTGRRSAASTTAAAALLLLAGCGGSDSSGDNSNGADATSEAGKTAHAALEKISEPFTAPTDLASTIDVSGLKGKTVYYVPIALKVGHFSIVQKTLEAALGEAGVKLYACDGQGSPSGIGACLDQAIGTKPAAIITDYIPYEMAGTVFEKVREAGIPLLIGAQKAPDGVATDETFAFNDPDDTGFATVEAMTDTVIADSDATANVLFLKVIDSPSTNRAGDAALAHLESACPDCKVTEQDVSVATIKDVPSQVSSAILKDATIDYVIPQYDNFVPLAISGIQSAGKTRDIKLSSSGGALLASVQLVQSNPQVIADVGANPAYLAWTYADSALRLMLGQEPPTSYPALIRAFTKDNVGDLTLDPANEASGAWYGDPTTYQDTFRKAWGLQ